MSLSREVENVMTEIEARRWAFMTQDSFNPVTMALQLLDSTANSPDLNAFLELMQRLENGMDTIINDNYQQFNNAVETFGRVTDTISDSQSHIRQLKENLSRCKDLLLVKRTDLMELWVKSVQYKEMLRMLDTIDELRRAPQKAEQLARQKYYLAAVKTALEALHTLRSSDFSSIGALEDVRLHLTSIKDSMHLAIIEDLHRYLYMRAPGCDESLFGAEWGDDEIMNSVMNDLRQKSGDNMNLKRTGSKKGKRLRANSDSRRQPSSISSIREVIGNNAKKSGDAAADIAMDEQLAEDLERNPEEIPLHFVEIMLTALNMLGKTTDTLLTLKQRLPVELFRLNEQVIEQIQQQYPDVLLAARDYATGLVAKSIITQGYSKPKVKLLTELLRSSYSKLVWVMNMHRHVTQCLARIAKRNERAPFGHHLNEGAGQTEMRFSIGDTWKAIQSEVKTLLSDYLVEIKNMAAVSSGPTSPSKDAGSKGGPRRVLFRFANTSVDEKVESVQTVTRHKVLVDPSIFNIIAVFKPTYDFVARIQSTFSLTPAEETGATGGSSSEMHTFLDQYLIKYFLPQLEERAAHQFFECVNALDAFRVDHTQHGPLFRSTPIIFDIVKELCLAVYKIPAHHGEVLRIIETMLEKYLEKCLVRFDAFVMTEAKPKSDETNVFSGTLIMNEGMQQLLRESPSFNGQQSDSTLVSLLAKKEMNLVLRLKGARSLIRNELIFDERKWEFISCLCTSALWIIDSLKKLRRDGERAQVMIELKPFSEVLSETHRDFSLESILSGKRGTQQMKSAGKNGMEISANLELELPDDYLKEAIGFGLDLATSDRLVKLWNSYQSAYETALFVLRTELRVHCVNSVELAVHEGNYTPEHPEIEPDNHILMLNHSLMQFHQVMARILPAKQMFFVLEGLGGFLDALFVHNARFIRRFNPHGMDKMLRNILAVQQNLSLLTMQYQPSLDRSSKYYSQYRDQPDVVVKRVEEEGPLFSFEEYKWILDLKNQHVIQSSNHPLLGQYNDALARLKRVCG